MEVLETRGARGGFAWLSLLGGFEHRQFGPEVSLGTYEKPCEQRLA